MNQNAYLFVRETGNGHIIVLPRRRPHSTRLFSGSKPFHSPAPQFSTSVVVVVFLVCGKINGCGTTDFSVGARGLVN